ncbi:MAG TPA: efflux RND transporter periplasmic adaptor subunit [Planctomycetaceae bacterium]|jgi:multidrug efflux system membrane fusion protein|nr:efflux RND transporter periplasmic adaptor subunit [Planctomycetaceae bacterium]
MARSSIFVLFIACLLASIGGCAEAPAQLAPSQPPAVPVSKPVQQEVTDYVDFTGRTDAVQAVNVIARVTGYLVQMPFKEGSEVMKDQLLFEIDPRPYQDQLSLGQAQLATYKAQQQLADADFVRATRLIKDKTISEQQFEQYKSTKEQAASQVQSAQANIAIYKLNLEFTRVTSPIDGRVSRYYLTLGNLVNQDQTLLTTVVSQDPMYAYFDTDEPTLLRVRRAVAEGKIKPAVANKNPVSMGLQDEEGFPHAGTIDFINNQVNPTTGSVSVRGVFPNPILSQGVRLLSPGMFVRIRLPIGAQHPALLVIDRAISSDQGLKYVYVIDAQNKVQYRRVTTGALQENGLRVIQSGLKPEDWVAVGALQQVRPGMNVRPDQTAMPTLGASPSEGAQGSSSE